MHWRIETELPGRPLDLGAMTPWRSITSARMVKKRGSCAGLESNSVRDAILSTSWKRGVDPAIWRGNRILPFIGPKTRMVASVDRHNLAHRRSPAESYLQQSIGDPDAKTCSRARRGIHQRNRSLQQIGLYRLRQVAVRGRK
jgi:hypothetical protein